MNNNIQFLLNGQPVKVCGVSPTTTLLQWLREHQHIMGTKEGCAEGDCGACTVVIGQLSPDDTLSLLSINACIRFLPTLHGKAIFTVEFLRQQNNGNLHPVQQAMVDYHGSQCGFCTPGFVMSLWQVYVNAEVNTAKPTDEKSLRSALSGNLCRCTGYRPILEAGQKMFDYPKVPLHRAGIIQALKALALDINPLPSEGFTYRYHENERFDAPTTIAAWLSLRAQFPQATLVAGATDVGLWVTKQMRALPHLIYVGDIAELKAMREENDTLIIGAGVSLNDAYAAICKHYPALEEIWERFASTPIRHAGSLGGNVANGSPIGDSMPALIALGCKVLLGQYKEGRVKTRLLPMEDFYIAYQKKAWEANEALLAMHLPLPTPHNINTPTHYASYKVAKRYDSDISAVCAAFALVIKDGLINSARIAYGGMAATPLRARHTEAQLIAKPWHEATLMAAMSALEKDYQPLSDMRASAAYRAQVAKNLLRRFYEECQLKDTPERTTQVISVFAAPTVEV